MRKYDLDGNLLWSTSYDPPAGSAFLNNIFPDQAGHLYVVGAATVAGQDQNLAVFKFDRSGTLLRWWDWNGPLNSADGASLAVLDAASNLYVLGGTPGPASGPDFDVVTMKLTQSPTATRLMTLGTASPAGRTLQVTARLTRFSDGSPLAGRQVAVLIDGVTAGSATTDADGKAVLPHVVTEGFGEQMITAEYAGDGVTYAGDSSNAHLNVR